MTRLRYIADNPRGPRGGNHDIRTLFSSPESARRSVLVHKNGARGQVLIVDLDALFRVPAKEESSAAVMDQTYSWHAARMQYHASEMARLRPIAESTHPEVLIANDAEQIGRAAEAGLVRARSLLSDSSKPAWLTTTDLAELREVVSEWYLEEDRLRRGGGATPATARAFFVLRDLWRSGKLGGKR